MRRSWIPGGLGLVFVENFHGGIFLHIVVPVEVVLKFVVGVEGPLNVLDRTGKTENLVLHYANHCSL